MCSNRYNCKASMLHIHRPILHLSTSGGEANSSRQMPRSSSRIGETIRRINSRAIAHLLKEDIKEAAGPLQLCAGHVSGCEAAIHAMNDFLLDSPNDAVVLVDATNVFNNLNREIALRNISVLCPSLATILINIYQSDVQMFISSETILSQEGTTQGDPLSMTMYTIASAPLIQYLQTDDVCQIWYADDASATSKLKNPKAWWDRLNKIGPKFGYYPNASKTWLIVKEEAYDEAHTIFDRSDIQITTEGHRYLGSSLGTSTFAETYIKARVESWTAELVQLSEIALSQPHTAYAAYVHGVKRKWTFLSRTCKNIGHLFQPLEEVICSKFIPALMGRSTISDTKRELFALPPRLGGLGISHPASRANIHYQASKTITAPLTSLIKTQAASIPSQINEDLIEAKKQVTRRTTAEDIKNQEEDTAKLTIPQQRSVTLAKEKGASTWLSVKPIEEHGFALNKGEFRDALCLRYGWRPKHLPSHCICGKAFNAEHAMSCNHGGVTIKRHNKIRDITAQLMNEVCKGVGVEPSL